MQLYAFYILYNFFYPPWNVACLHKEVFYNEVPGYDRRASLSLLLSLINHVSVILYFILPFQFIIYTFYMHFIHIYIYICPRYLIFPLLLHLYTFYIVYVMHLYL